MVNSMFEMNHVSPMFVQTGVTGVSWIAPGEATQETLGTFRLPGSANSWGLKRLQCGAPQL
jgi:hypothetical protein